MNYGNFINKIYIKKVTFAKAVLWHTRQLSLRQDIINRIKSQAIEKIIFVDELKKERWIFKPEKVFAKMELKNEGQESQYYFPIDICKKEKIPDKKKYVYTFDPVRNIYIQSEFGASPEPESVVVKQEEKPEVKSIQLEFLS